MTFEELIIKNPHSVDICERNDVYVDFTDAEIEAVEKLTGLEARDDADMRRALHSLMYELAKYKGVKIPSLEESEE